MCIYIYAYNIYIYIHTHIPTYTANMHTHTSTLTNTYNQNKPGDAFKKDSFTFHKNALMFTRNPLHCSSFHRINCTF